MDLSPLYVSLKVAFSATAVTVLFGIPAGWYVFKIKRFKGLIDGVFTLPMVLPPTVVGFFLLTIFGRNSLIGSFLLRFDISVVFTWIGAVVASTVVAFPLMYRTVRGAFEQFDINMIYAARTLGIAEFKIFYKVVIPNVLPSIVAGTVLSFARALGEFGATMMLAGNIPGKTQTIALSIYTAVQAGDKAKAYNWVLIICTMSFTSMILINFWNRAQEKRTAKRGDI
ncbi:molybdate transport system permease protein [Ruminiclostridium sufflavum DSM 19573]|uniref:Molybdenum transport system permease n=1 Tax=Ruminiclostridium sufflavum DSM 19573 TaxID=1121337 RepID=A0A318XIZ5_9FIRM|nr:molybdate ABC transporter permease subunit [Ruminiclostridium sufflavum]PYG84829.1 molybdate transport system permease protein [Ruminiclostridium sufflavum DSM 19573]